MLVSSYCTGPEKQTTNPELTGDEQALVDALVGVSLAKDAFYANPLESDSLFAHLDSTVDTTRISNTVRALEGDPDRWILVYEAVKERLQNSSQGQGQGSPSEASE